MTNPATHKSVCFFLSSLGGGGAERMAVNFANNLSPAKYNISIIVLNLEGSYLKNIRHDVSIYSLNMGLIELNPFNNLIKLFKLIKILRKIKAQTIISIGYYCNYLAIIARFLSCKKTKLLIRETNLLIARQNNKSHNFFKHIAFSLLYPLIDIFIAPSQAIIDDFKHKYNLKNIPCVVVPNFIDFDFIQSSLQKTSSLDPTSEYPQDRPIIISLGRLVTQKGYKNALLAFKKVLKTIPCYYWILGEGPLQRELKEEAKFLNIERDVKFLGFQKNPYFFLNKATVFFLPSQYEGFPNALLEAMYFNLPSVVTHFNESVNNIITEGREGFVTDVNDTEKMASGLKKILTDTELLHRMKDCCQTQIQNYSVNRILPLLEEII